MKAGVPIGADLRRCAARARGRLRRPALARLSAFISTCEAPGGGFRGRGSGADLYYTLFGVLTAGLVGASIDRRRLAAYLAQQEPATLDLPHLAAFIQCQRLLHWFGVPRQCRAAGLAALASCRRPDGGFGEAPGPASGTAYGLYLATLSYEVMGAPMPDVARAIEAGSSLLRDVLAKPPWTLAPIVSLALALQALGCPAPAAAVCEALAACQDGAGGFRAHPQAPLADLLSTAVAAFARRRLGSPLRGQEAATTARFVQALWTESGGFCGTLADPVPDCEYTFYGLLASGSMEA